MNITVDWDDDSKRIVVYTFRATWMWEDFFKAVEKAKALIDTAPGDVGVIMGGETRYMRLPPNSLTHFRSALRATHPKTRIVVIVSENVYLSMVLDTLTRITGARGSKLKLVGGMDEARALVRARLSEAENKPSTPQPDGE
jgi:carbohydrate-binding DOMON domain-containing protein